MIFLPGAGIEPARYYYRRILSPVRLPIPPSGRVRSSYVLKCISIPLPQLSCGILNLASKITSFSFVLLGKIGTSGQKKTTVVVVLFYYFWVYFVKYLRECNSNIGKDFSIKRDILFCHASDEGAVFIALFFYCRRQSFDPELSKISLFLFPAFVGMLSLFDQCKSDLLVYFASSESEPFCKPDAFFVSSLSLKSTRYSYHLNYWL